jgi:radical SAM-linked protein
MQPDAAPPPALPPPPPRAFAKYRFRFRKSADLRLLSHHDLMRAFERLLRRADLPVRQTQGFHPKPRLVFALSLPLGVVGCEEVAELELDEPLDPDEVHARLAAQAPPGLDVLSLQEVPPKTTAQVRRLTYRLALPPERAAGLAEKIAAVLAAPELWIERTRPPRRRLDLRPILADLRLLTSRQTSSPLLEMELSLTPEGTARPDELLALLGLEDLPAAGVVLERSRLLLHDEAPNEDRPPHTANAPHAEGNA